MDEEAKSGLSQEQKIGFILLLVFGIVGLTLGAVKIRNQMFAPFSLNNTVPSAIKDQLSAVDAMKYRDTDGDGLSDYDEEYVYGTSRFQPDTFNYGNGLTDKDVVERNLPRCGNAGKDCSDASTPIGTTPTTTATADSLQAVLGAAPPDLNQILSSPTEIRKMLIENGMSKDMLDTIKDSDLMAVVNQVMTSSTTSGTKSATPQQTASTNLSQVLSSPAEIRKMLIANGMSQAVLDKVKDQDLMVLVNQIMASSTFSNTKR